MTDDSILVLKCLFETIWMLFTSWYIPGTDVTPAGAFMFFAFAGLALRFLYRLVGLVPSGVDFGVEDEDPIPHSESDYATEMATNFLDRITGGRYRR